MTNIFSVVTDTATISIFDLQAIRHRLADSPDWWSIVEDEIQEINNGNIIFLGVGDDGKYDVQITDEQERESGVLNLNVPSGKVFVGAGEDTTGGGLEPDGAASIQGRVIELKPGPYQVMFKKVADLIIISFRASTAVGNKLDQEVRI